MYLKISGRGVARRKHGGGTYGMKMKTAASTAA